MQNLDATKVETLMTSEPGYPAITMYMPTHKESSPSTLKEDKIRFKNLTQKLLKNMQAFNKHREFAQQFESKTHELLNDIAFWKHQQNALLICSSRGLFECYRLPFETEEFISINNHFYVSPLAGMKSELQECYVLAFSLKNPTLYTSDAYSLNKQEIGLPASVEDALNIDEEHQRSLQFSSVDGPKGAMYHGHGASKDTGHADVQKFMKIVDHSINESVNTDLPLILAGTPTELSSYRQLATYPNLLESQIEQDLTYSEENLQEYTRRIVSEVSSMKHLELSNKMNELGIGSSRVSVDLDAIGRAAKAGRVQSLILNLREVTRDTIKDTRGQVNKVTFPKESMLVDRLNAVAREVANKGGNIINVTTSYMPGNTIAAAIHRY